MDQEYQGNRSPQSEQEGDGNECSLQHLSLDDGSSEPEAVGEPVPSDDVEVNADGMSTPIVEPPALGVDVINPMRQAITPHSALQLSESIGFRPIVPDINPFTFNQTPEEIERANANVLRRLMDDEVDGRGGNSVVFIVRRNGVSGPRSRVTPFASRFPPVDAFNRPRNDPRLNEAGWSYDDPGSSESGARTGRRRCPRSFSIFY